MTSLHEETVSLDHSIDAEIARLGEENEQLRQAVESHAVVDQAIGVLAAVCRVPPAEGWQVLREVSQHLNIKVRSIAQDIVDWALGRPLAQPVRRELDAAVQRRPVSP
jgi:AmiR/NasT family two-component response regulator